MSDYEYCCAEPATHFCVPTMIGKLADLCKQCAARYGPLTMETTRAAGGRRPASFVSPIPERKHDP